MIEQGVIHPKWTRPDLTPLLRARSLAIVGASATPGSFGNALLRQARNTGFAGNVYAINPGRSEIDGLPCYSTLSELPETVDCAMLAVGDGRLEDALREVVAHGIPAAVIFGGMAVHGDADPLPERLQRIAQESGLALLGGNCMGFYNYGDHLFVSGYPVHERAPAGGIAVVSHSGSSFSALANSGRELRFSYLISPGQELVLTAADYLRFLVQQPETRVVGLFLESVRDPEGFVTALQAAAQRETPVVALKVGRSAQGRAMALAHSGALAGSDAAFAALCERWGVIQVDSLDAVGDALELLAAPRRAHCGGLALAGDSGGERALLVDRAAELGVPWATLSDGTTRAIAAQLEPGLEAGNPLDLWGSGKDWQQVYRTCLTALTHDDAVGITVLAVDLVPGSRLAPDYVEIMCDVYAQTGAAMAVLGNMSTTIDRSLASKLRAAGLPVLMGSDTGLLALRAALTWKPASPWVAIPDHDKAMAAGWQAKLATHDMPLDEVASKQLLADWGIPVVAERLVEDEAAARQAATEMGWPVVLKSAAPGLLHKSDVGAVHLNLQDDMAIAGAYRELAARFGPRVVVQRQVDLADKVELFLGMSRDAQFGPLVTFGLGGIWVEVLGDVAFALPPIDPAAAEAMVARLHGAAMLGEVRGRPAVHVPGVVEAIVAFGRMAAALGDCLEEVDINPILAGPEGVVAVDGLVVPRGIAPPQGH